MQPFWNPPPKRLFLSDREVHVWRAGLDLSAETARVLAERLSADELTRSGHYRFERDRIRFIAARGILRLILGRYLGIEPDAIRFFYEKNGKPRLQNTSGDAVIKFNLSHSEGLALYVFARDYEVGIDLEYICEISEMELIVEQFFSAKEKIVFGTLPASGKQETFFNWWTRKEAFTKATGNGLYYPLDTFDVSVAPGESDESLKILGYAKKGPTWSMWDVRPAEAFTGAVVIRARDFDVQFWQWSDLSSEAPRGKPRGILQRI